MLGLCRDSEQKERGSRGVYVDLRWERGGGWKRGEEEEREGEGEVGEKELSEQTLDEEPNLRNTSVPET